MRISMWWDGVWVGCRLDSEVCPIYKHTDVDTTCDVNEVRVFTGKRFTNHFKLLNFMNSPTMC